MCKVRERLIGRVESLYTQDEQVRGIGSFAYCRQPVVVTLNLDVAHPAYVAVGHLREFLFCAADLVCYGALRQHTQECHLAAFGAQQASKKLSEQMVMTAAASDRY